MIRAVIFDLDNTLFDEREYVASGFHAVASRIAALTGAQNDAAYRFMQQEVERNGRGRVFDVTLGSFGVTPTPDLIEELVSIYRQNRPDIRLYPDAERVLDRLRGDYAMAIVTDGLPLMQRAKLNALGLSRWMDTFVCCWEIEAPKPDPRGFRLALEQLGVAPHQALVVGDRPDHDMAAARALGVPSVRLRRGRYADDEPGDHRPDHEIDTLDELTDIIAARNNV
jgi:putative hydrolase of the HAD superfamily